MKEEEIEKEQEAFELASQDSDLLSPEMKEQKRRNERFAFMCGIIAQFLWACHTMQLKASIVWFQEVFTLNNLIFYRSIAIIAISYYLMKYNKKEFKKYSEINYKFWFVFRNIGLYVTLQLYTLMNIFFRASTSQCITNSSPVVILIISAIILRERFYLRYITGLLICFLGAFLIISNENKDQDSEEKSIMKEGEYSNPLYRNMTLGLFVAFCEIVGISFSNFGQKMITKDKIEGDEQNFYVGIFGLIPSFFVMVFQWKTGLTNIGYVLFCASQAVVFYLANFCTSVAFKYISINKFVPLYYLSMIFAFILGYVLYGEKVYFTDIIGSLFIMGFQVYNIYVPTT